MGHAYLNREDSANFGRGFAKHHNYQPMSTSWFEQRVFYVRFSNFEVDELTPEYLTLSLIPHSPDTILEVNGRSCSISSDCEPSLLRRDRFDKKSEEATYVSTGGIRMTGSVKFEVYDRDERLLIGLLEMSEGNCFGSGESRNSRKCWNMKCRSAVANYAGILRGKQEMVSEAALPKVEVYVAGCFCGTPTILTQTLRMTVGGKHSRKGFLDSTPKYETAECKTDVPCELLLQPEEFQELKHQNRNRLGDYNCLYSRGECMEIDNGELSWFNAGVRAGVGISLGICLGIGVGVGLLVSTYQATTWSFKRRLP